MAGLWGFHRASPSCCCNPYFQAIGIAQEAGLCCVGYTFALATDLQTKDGNPIVELCYVSFGDVKSLAEQIRNLAKNSSSLILGDALHRCATLAHRFLKVLPSNEQSSLKENDLHCCCLAVQFLCLSFVLFLVGHRSTYPLPILRTRLSRIRLAGSRGSIALSAWVLEPWPVLAKCCKTICLSSKQIPRPRQSQKYRDKSQNYKDKSHIYLPLSRTCGLLGAMRMFFGGGDSYKSASPTS